MNKKFILLFGAAAVIGTGLIICWVMGTPISGNVKKNPVTIIYAGVVNRASGFMVSNRTDQPLMVCMSALEMPTSSTWSNCLGDVPPQGLMFPNQMIGIPGELVLPAHAHGVEVFLVEPPAGRWRARFVVLRQERHMAKVAEVVAPTLRQFHLLPPLAPSPYKLRVRTTADGRTAVQAFAPIYEMVVENITSPASAELVGDWLGGGLDNARDAVRAKLAELDGTNSHGKSENSSNQSPK